MSKIDDLIAKLCPEGVEFRELGEVFTIRNGYTPSKKIAKYWEDGTLPWFRMEDIRKNGRILSDSIQKITPQAVKSGGLFPAGSIIMATTATIGEHALLTADSLANQRFTFLTRKSELLGSLDEKFVFYYCFELADWCKKNTNVSGFASVDMNGFKKFQFPLPPLAVQREIVDILDKFTQLEAELEAELEARKKQYEHYRNQLLTFDDNAGGVRWATLGEAGKLVRGNGLQKKDFIEEGYPCIHYGQIYTYYGTFTDKTKSFVSHELAEKLKKAQTGDVIITNTSENIEDVGKSVVWCGSGEIVTGGHATIFKPKLVSGKYFAYYTQTSAFYSEKRKYAKGTKVIDVSATDMAKIKIPIPPLAEQNRIVAILDKFDALTTDISTGLPAELAARRKQYEYYRNKLLTFEEKKGVASV